MAAILSQAGRRLIVEEIEVSSPGPGEVLVRNLASGICHSQLHQIRSDQPYNRPLLLGHEAAADVLAVGDGVVHVQPGDRVLLTWHRRNAQPGDGQPPPVTSARWRGEPIADEFAGIYTWSQHSLVRHEYVVPIPPGIAPDVASVIGCAVMTGAGAVINSADVPAGRSAAVIGVGGVGLSAVVALAIRAAAPIIAIDLDDAKLAFAQRFGATVLVNAGAENATERVRAETNGGVDFAFDCIGLSQTTRQALEMARPGDWTVSRGGMAVLVGWPTASAPINALDLVVGEKTLIGSAGGSSRPQRDFPLFYQWYRDAQLDLDALVTERRPLSDINAAADKLAQGRVLGRSVITFNQ
ncbi:MAG: zinc-binding dehydrogenase [Dehalococcoidia bacterium]